MGEADSHGKSCSDKLYGNCRSLELMSFVERSSSGAGDDRFKGGLIQLKPRRRRKNAAHGASRGRLAT
ncbi:MAG: hypothetical protein DMG93_08935 [Acidobacteria bacterium]|nr:MAG: hypothetical protein DMG93_08935 [Acidobacteriota bacterium]